VPDLVTGAGAIDPVVDEDRYDEESGGHKGDKSGEPGSIRDRRDADCQEARDEDAKPNPGDARASPIQPREAALQSIHLGAQNLQSARARRSPAGFLISWLHPSLPIAPDEHIMTVVVRFPGRPFVVPLERWLHR
jgi:hypothetical protein